MQTFWINYTIFLTSCFGAMHLNILFLINLLQTCLFLWFKPQSDVTFVEKIYNPRVVRYRVPKHFTVEFFNRPYVFDIGQPRWGCNQVSFASPG